MARRSKAKARCPQPEHEGSRIKFNGTYGPHGHRRQRYRCLPSNGDPAHGFTELLPREEAWRDACDRCERAVARHEGPQAPRKHQFVARGIAEALVAVGSGASYMRASRIARERAHRFRNDPLTGEPRESAHGQLVADWVEVFAPVVFEPHRPSAWPASGTLVLDHRPFRVRALDPSGRPIPAGKVAFDVFCAMGYEAGRPRIWRLEAFRDADTRSWLDFLDSLPGEPPRVVCDAHLAMLKAISLRWPQTDLYLCEWHLAKALRRLLAKLAKAEPVRLSPLLERADGALAGVHFWRPFCRQARALALPRLDAWLDAFEPIIEWQFARRGHASQRAVGMPLTVGGLEQLTRPVEQALRPRRYALKNRERLNRLLPLMQLHANGEDRVDAYTRAIRDWLVVHGGSPPIRRRAIADRLHSPSLR